MQRSVNIKPKQANRTRSLTLVWDILLIAILLAGAYLRFVGMDWDTDTHLHPDERFMTMVESAITPVHSLKEYFNTQTSTLNPNNVGYGFYVYGTLPLFLVRYIADWLGKAGYGEVYLVGRGVSAVADLLTILLVYLTARKLFKRAVPSLLAAAFTAFAVLQIQLSHYFTVDILANLFSFLTFYIAVRIMLDDDSNLMQVSGREKDGEDWSWLWKARRSVIPYALFGIALGLAASSKVSAAPFAVLLPGAVLVKYLHLSSEQRKSFLPILVRNIFVAGFVSILVFRIFQPYAFSGPGFFGLKPNSNWISNLRELSQQSSGDVDFPPALQWARRPIWFAWQNMVEWGMGLPLGLLASAGFLWMGWKVIKGEWREYALLWGFTGLYFTWQSFSFTSSMRYILPVYPMFTIIAAWVIFELWQGVKKTPRYVPWGKVLSAALGTITIITTFAWAFAFSRIYTRPVTRVAASDWIYQNVPGPINLHIENNGKETNQPLPFTMGSDVTFSQPLVMSFNADYQGSITKLDISHILNKGIVENTNSIAVILSQTYPDVYPIANGVLNDQFKADADPRGNTYAVEFNEPAYVNKGENYYLIIQLMDQTGLLSFYGPLSLSMITSSGIRQQPLPDPVFTLTASRQYKVTVAPVESGTLKEVFLPKMLDWKSSSEPQTIHLTIADISNENAILASSTITDTFGSQRKAQTFILDKPVNLDTNAYYTITISLEQGNGRIAVYGSKQALETSWDDPLPIGLDGYNPFDYYSGIYRTDLNLEMYWDDNADKLQRFYSILDQSDYLFISSSRQWGTTVRVPERYPLTTAYYRSLLGCPDDKDILWCYSVAKPGKFQGQLGFDLVQVFQSEPNLGPLVINTQPSEEAFTVYDHPKVFIFKKNANFNLDQVRKIFGSVDLSMVVHLTPHQASEYPGNLMLPTVRLVAQRLGGTWSELFQRGNLLNRYPLVGVIVWYLTITTLGWILYPLTRLAFSGLSDRGFPLSKFLGLLLLALPVWLAGSAGIPFTPLTITFILLGLVVVGLLLGWLQREQLRVEIKERWRYYLAVEAVFLAIFTIGLLVRLGNPDLWHPYKGGEKPMDFSYFNAVLKSTTFPPYDPWFAGGYINYYYYGFVLVGAPVKWLGIIPSVAYNIILPTLLGLLGMGTFTMGWNLAGSALDRYLHRKNRKKGDFLSTHWGSFLAGIAAALLLVFLGNLGTIRMIWHGLQKLASPAGIEGVSFFQRIAWTIQGIGKFLNGASLPYSAGDWYWIPSRVYPGEPITEFPAFTFLYADLHAHLIDLPITVMALCWGLSLLKTRWEWPSLDGRLSFLAPALTFLAGAVTIGAIRPTNTWDLPVYLVLALLAVGYTSLRYAHNPLPQLKYLPAAARKWVVALASIACFTLLTLILYQPFSQWYGQGYNSIALWKGDHSPFWSYITHWGLFLFIIISWLFWETRDWMASTPASSLNKLKPFQSLILTILALLVIAVVALLIMGVGIAWMVLPVAAWACVLIFRPNQPDVKRAVLFMVGTALLLTLAVEVIVLEGDIGRMNTVFKFYLQAWTLLSISAGAALIWLVPAVLEQWNASWRSTFQVGLAVLVGCAALFPLLGGLDKIRDRITSTAPHTLDGMAYMEYANYPEDGVYMSLSQDYDAIQWMQDNIQGSPVIVEANTPEYRWGTRYTIYTGLPGVVGWNWHQRQQRAVTSSTWVTDRVAAVGDFYQTLDRQETISFLQKYQVQYIVVGQLEKIVYTGSGIDKFINWNDDLWHIVYQKDDTTIYQVNTIISDGFLTTSK